MNLCKNGIIMDILKIKQLVRKTYLYRYVVNRYKYLIVKFNPYKEIQRCYAKAYPGRHINLTEPKNLIEKIYWMEWNTDTSLWSKCADKYLVREYIKESGLEYILPKLWGVWKNPYDIDFDNLPNEFILKTNDGCGTNYIVKDKYKEDVGRIRRLFKQYLKIKQGYTNAQYHYLDIEQCVIAEELLCQSEELNNISPNSLVDYKFYCINGNVECINILFDRRDSHVRERIYDKDWNDMDNVLIEGSHYIKDVDINVPRPKCLEEMITIAEKLSKPFPQVRVDLYNIKDRPIFGELTFSTGYGDMTEDYINYLGSKIDLSKMKRVVKKI